MKRILAVLMLTILSCSPRFQEMQALLGDPENIIVPFDSTFLGYQPVMDLFHGQDTMLSDSLERIVFTGSSSIRMWDSLSADFDTLPYLVLNRGFGGSTLPQVNYFFDDLITPHKPKMVVLYCGENDIKEGQSPKDVLASFRTFLRLLFRDAPDSKVLYIGMKPSPARWKLWPEFVDANRLIAQLIDRLDNPGIRYLDIASSMLDPVNQYPVGSHFIDDSLHMTPVGYERWQAAILPIIDNMVCED